MTPADISIVLAIAAIVLAGVRMWLARYLRKLNELMAAMSAAPRPPTPTADRSDNDLVRLAIEEMSKVSQLALAPYPAGANTPDEQLRAPRNMPGLELIPDDDTDPLEAYLGPDFRRGVSDVYDEADESPFGVPGLKAIPDEQR